MKNILRILHIEILVLLTIVVFSVASMIDLQAQHREPVMVCKGDSVMPLVRSHDGTLYRVDVCAVVTSAEGDIFRYQVDEK